MKKEGEGKGRGQRSAQEEAPSSATLALHHHTITHLKILKISSISESPGNRGWRMIISAKMQPTDHMSTPVE
jgi:hypothetical protein